MTICTFICRDRSVIILLFPLSGNTSRAGPQIPQTALNSPQNSNKFLEESNPRRNFTGFAVKCKLDEKQSCTKLSQPLLEAAVFSQQNVQSDEVPQQNRKVPEWIQILNEQKEWRLNKVLD